MGSREARPRGGCTLLEDDVAEDVQGSGAWWDGSACLASQGHPSTGGLQHQSMDTRSSREEELGLYTNPFLMDTPIIQSSASEALGCGLARGDLQFWECWSTKVPDREQTASCQDSCVCDSCIDGSCQHVECFHTETTGAVALEIGGALTAPEQLPWMSGREEAGANQRLPWPSPRKSDAAQQLPAAFCSLMEAEEVEEEDVALEANTWGERVCSAGAACCSSPGQLGQLPGASPRGSSLGQLGQLPGAPPWGSSLGQLGQLPGASPRGSSLWQLGQLPGASPQASSLGQLGQLPGASPLGSSLGQLGQLPGGPPRGGSRGLLSTAFGSFSDPTNCQLAGSEQPQGHVPRMCERPLDAKLCVESSVPSLAHRDRGMGFLEAEYVEDEEAEAQEQEQDVSQGHAATGEGVHLGGCFGSEETSVVFGNAAQSVNDFPTVFESASQLKASIHSRLGTRRVPSSQVDMVSQSGNSIALERCQMMGLTPRVRSGNLAVGVARDQAGSQPGTHASKRMTWREQQGFLHIFKASPPISPLRATAQEPAPVEQSGARLAATWRQQHRAALSQQLEKLLGSRRRSHEEQRVVLPTVPAIYPPTRSVTEASFGRVSDAPDVQDLHTMKFGRPKDLRKASGPCAGLRGLEEAPLAQAGAQMFSNRLAKRSRSRKGRKAEKALIRRKTLGAEDSGTCRSSVQSRVRDSTRDRHGPMLIVRGRSMPMPQGLGWSTESSGEDGSSEAGLSEAAVSSSTSDSFPHDLSLSSKASASRLGPRQSRSHNRSPAKPHQAVGPTASQAKQAQQREGCVAITSKGVREGRRLSRRRCTTLPHHRLEQIPWDPVLAQVCRRGNPSSDWGSWDAREGQGFQAGQGGGQGEDGDKDKGSLHGSVAWTTEDLMYYSPVEEDASESSSDAWTSEEERGFAERITPKTPAGSLDRSASSSVSCTSAMLRNSRALSTPPKDAKCASSQCIGEGLRDAPRERDVVSLVLSKRAFASQLLSKTSSSGGLVLPVARVVDLSLLSRVRVGPAAMKAAANSRAVGSVSDQLSTYEDVPSDQPRQAERLGREETECYKMDVTNAESIGTKSRAGVIVIDVPDDDP